MYTLFVLLKPGGLALVNEIRCYRNFRCLYIYINSGRFYSIVSH